MDEDGAGGGREGVAECVGVPSSECSHLTQLFIPNERNDLN